MSNTLLNYRTHVIAIVLALAVGLLPQLALGATYTVTKTTDTADGSCTVGDCSLREAVIAANENNGSDVIMLGANTYGLSIEGLAEQLAATGDLDIIDTTGATIIQGANIETTIIDANDIERIFDVTTSGANLELHNLTVTNGTATGGSGGGIYAYTGTTLELDTVMVSDNVIVGSDSENIGYGAGIAFFGSNLTISDSDITSNIGSVIPEDYVYGGGLAVMSGSSAEVTIERSAFSYNTARNGAGMYMHTDTGVDTIRNMNEIVVHNNSASAQGGGMYLAGGTGSASIVLTNALVASNLAATGAGIYALAPAEITNVSIHSNAAVGDGGGIYLQNQDYVELAVAHSTLTRNTAGANGGGIAVGGADAYILINGSIIGENTAVTAGDQCFDDAAIGGLYSGGYNYFSSITDCDFSPAPEDDTTTGPQSYMYTASPGNHGGNVRTLDIWANDVTRVVPIANCLDAAGEPLTRDARGYPRPEVGFCNMGAYEPDEIDPGLTLNGASTVVVTQGSAYTELGANATDNFGLSGEVQIESEVDTDVVGEYIVTYSVYDYDGNQAMATRTVMVVAPQLLVEVTVDDCGEGDDNAEVEAVLTTQPTATVTLEYESNDTTEGVPDPATITFTPDNWNEPQIASINCVDDDIDDGNIGFAILYTSVSEDADYNGITDGFSLINVDNDDAVVEHGAITAVAQTSGTLSVTYEDASTEDIIPFKGNANFRYVLSSNSNALIVTNGRRIKVYVQGSMVSSQKLNNPKLRRQFYRLKASKLYMNSVYDTIAFLSASKTQGKVVAFRLTSNYALTKKNIQEFTITDRSSMKLALKRPTKRLVATVGSGESKIQAKFTLTKKGTLTKLQ